MLVPNEVRKCVVFLMYLDKDQKYVFAGTGFFISIQPIELTDKSFSFLVTAKHVIVAIQQKSIDGKAYIRINHKQGGSQIIRTKIDDWASHPTDSSVDISVFRWAPPDDKLDYLCIPSSMIATEEKIIQESIGLGEEVFITGLFVSHFGKDRNTPIVRVGNIAAMPEEKVDTKQFGSIEVYLIEARSIGGLSGSPVFVNLGLVRNMNGRIAFAQNTNTGIFYLLGLIHGHWDRDETDVDNLVQDVDGGRVNMGIAMVVPATKILEIINQPKWVEERQAIVDEEKKKLLPIVDVADDKPNNDGIAKE